MQFSNVHAVELAFKRLTGSRLGLLQNRSGRLEVTTLPEFLDKMDRMGIQVNATRLRMTQAMYDPGSDGIVFFADRMELGKEEAVIAHELVHKNSHKVLDRSQWMGLVESLNRWSSAQPGSVEKKIHDWAHQHATREGRGRPGVFEEELLAYGVEAAVNLGVRPRSESDLNSADSWLYRAQVVMQKILDAQLGAGRLDVSAADLVDLAYAFARIEVSADRDALIAQLRQGLAGADRERVGNVPMPSQSVASQVPPGRMLVLGLGPQSPNTGVVPVRKSTPQVDSPEFKAWFGQSKVVKRSGKPKVVYHGTRTSFDIFQPSETGEFGAGVYFGSQDAAFEYASGDEGDQIVPVYLSLQNPLVIRGNYTLGEDKYGVDSPAASLLEHLFGEEGAAARFAALEATGDNKLGREIQEAVEALGHDGMVIDWGVTDDGAEVWYVAFRPEQIKSAIGNNGDFDPDRPSMLQSVAPPMFYSRLRRAIEQAPARLSGQPVAQWSQWLQSNAARLGLKSEEIQWSGILDFFSQAEAVDPKARLLRGQVLSFLSESGVVVIPQSFGEVATGFDVRPNPRRGGWEAKDPDGNWWGGYASENEARAAAHSPEKPKYAEYRAVPGGSRYRELLLTLPGQKVANRDHFDLFDEQGELIGVGIWPPSARTQADLQAHPGWRIERKAKIDRQDAMRKGVYIAAHWDVQNVLVHARVDEQEDAQGRRVLVVHEIQSDWGQEGRRNGFKEPLTPEEKSLTLQKVREAGLSDQQAVEAVRMASHLKYGVIQGPFVSKTESWVGLAIKRLVAYAAQNQLEAICFANGQQVCDMFNMSKQVGGVYFKVLDNQNGRGNFMATPPGITLDSPQKDWEPVAEHTNVDPERLSAYIGKDLAKRLLASEPVNGMHRIEGDGLKMSNDGILSFYDSLLPQIAADVFRKIGGGIPNRVPLKGDNVQFALEVDAGLREQVLSEGLPLFRSTEGFGSPEFSRWFAGSRVTDTGEVDGRPLVLYHATDRDFDQFGKTRDIGFHFGSAGTANRVLRDVSKRAAREKITDPALRLIPVYLSLKNPITLDADPGSWMPDYVIRLLQKQGALTPEDVEHFKSMASAALLDARAEGERLREAKVDVQRTRHPYLPNEWSYELKHWRWTQVLAQHNAPVFAAIRQALLDKGYDGLKYVNTYERASRKKNDPANISWVAFKPEQIKSALANTGEFDASSPDITRRSSDLTVTPEFQRWFGKSQIREKDGTPLVVYHGTKADIVAFDPAKTEDGGLHFGTAEQAAYRASGEGGQIMPVYLSAEKLKRFRDDGTGWIGKIKQAKKAGADGIVYLNRFECMTTEDVEDFAARGLLNKLDGMSDLQFKRLFPRAQDSFIVFKAEQVKSALANDGQFRPGQASILSRSMDRFQTPEFKAFFEGSRVVDELGRPRIMYHGTSRDFDAFDRLKSTQWRRPSMDTVGSWFSSDPDRAQGYAGGDGLNIRPVVLSIKNPKVYSRFNDFLRDMHAAEGRVLEEQNPRGIGSTEGLRNKLKAEGYDGIVFEQTDNGRLYRDIERTNEAIRVAKREQWELPKDQRAQAKLKVQRLEATLASLTQELNQMGGSTEFDGHDVWVAFEPEQIKSAIGNSGEFNPNEPNILRSELRSDLIPSDAAKNPLDFAGNQVIIEDGDRWSVYRERSAQLGDGFIRWVEDADAVGITDIQSGPSARGRDMVRWLAAETGKELMAIGVVEDAAAFWDRMEEEDLISFQTAEDFMSFYGRTVRRRSSAQVATPEFQRWFGDSKIVDERGQPLVVYHGSAGKEFTVFSRRKLGRHNDNIVSKLGFFFTPDKDIADDYAYQASWNLAPDDKPHTGDDQRIYSVYLAISNPIVIDATKIDGFVAGAEELARLVKDAKTKGHDGAIINNWDDGSGADVQYIAFKPEQIKSATDNNGEFDAANPDITRRALQQVATPEFKAYFGKSKVVDEWGAPKVVYHGTRSNIQAFDANKVGTNVNNPTTKMGFFFTESANGAERWANYRGMFSRTAEGQNLMPVFLAIEKPRKISATRFLYLLKSARASTIGKFIEETVEAGYDGFQIEYDGTSDSGEPRPTEQWWVAFKPEQIKSAIGNNGEFDVTNPDIARRALTQLQTPEFLSWFDRSQILDAGEQPLVVYHYGSFGEGDNVVPSTPMHFGTRAAALQRAHAKLVDDAAMAVTAYVGDNGAWHWDDAQGLTSEDLELPGFSDEVTALEFGRSRLIRTMNEDYAMDNSSWGVLTPAFLSIRNPKRVIDVGGASGEWEAEIQKAREEGYDGIVYRNKYEDVGSDSFIAFEPGQIKSAESNSGEFNPNNPNILLSARTPYFYSELQRQIENAPARMGQLPAAEWLGWLKSNAASLGIKQDELQWSGLVEYLTLMGAQKIDRSHLVDYLSDSGLVVEALERKASGVYSILDRGDGERYPFEVNRYGEPVDAFKSYMEALEFVESQGDHEQGSARYGGYRLIGGSDYAELLITARSRRLPKVVWTAARLTEKHQDLLALGCAEDLLDQARELLVEMKDDTGRACLFADRRGQQDVARFIRGLVAGAVSKDVKDNYSAQYRSSHWSERNVLAHVRFDIRSDQAGRRTMFVQEIQSDWGQDGRKQGFLSKDVFTIVERNKDLYRIIYKKTGEAIELADRVSGFGSREAAQLAIDTGRVFGAYSVSGIVDGPFVKKTEAWTALAIKQAMVYAAQNGVQAVAFATGDQVATIFDVKKTVEHLTYLSPQEGYELGYLQGTNADGHLVLDETIAPSQVAAFVGESVAKELFAQPADGGLFSLEDPGLTVGGRGVMRFYDEVLPPILKEVARKTGAGQVETCDLGFGPQLALPVSDMLVERLSAEGMPLFRAITTPTDTPEFHAWFRASKVVDKAGEPLAVYHGTPDVRFDRFDPARAGQNTHARDAKAGFFFTNDQDFAARFLSKRVDDSLTGQRIEEKNFGKPEIKKVFLSLQNPVDLRKLTLEVAEKLVATGALGKYATAKQTVLMSRSAEGSKEIQMNLALAKAELEAAGFDGIVNKVLYKGRVRTEFMAFHPEQIKSADANQAELDEDATRNVVAPHRHPEFQSWFDGSRAADADGQPLVLYHGTNFQFDQPEGPLWLSSRRDVAQTYADDAEGRVIAFYASLKNPLVIDANYDVWNDIEFEGVGWNSDSLVQLARMRGHDGVIVRNVIDGKDTEFSDDAPPSDVYVVLGPDQLKFVDATRDQVPEHRRGTVQVHTPEFAAWSGGAPLVDLEKSRRHTFKSGKPVVVESLHGTTHTDISVFDVGKANWDSNIGGGIYSTNNPGDAHVNYASFEGPDLKSRISNLDERLSDSFDFGDPDTVEAVRAHFGVDDVDGLTNEQVDEAIRALAKAQLVGEAPNVMKLFVRFNNPAVLGGKGETFLDYEMGEEDTVPSGLLAKLIQRLYWPVPNIEIRGNDLVSIQEALEDELMNEPSGGLKLSRVIEIIEEKGVDICREDTGETASSEFVRILLERLGFDGVIDTTVFEKFGVTVDAYGRKVPTKMKNLNASTVHFIAFKPEQIKSAVGNRGTFDPNDPDITRCSTSQLKSPEFARWFGKSVLLDEVGQPRVAYHGTASKEPFASFDIARSGQTAGVGGGFFFTNRKDVAEDVYGWRSGRPALEVYLKMERPLTLEAYLAAKGLDRDEELHGGRDSPTNYFDNTHPAMMDFAKANGFDSIMLVDDSGDEYACDLYVVFEPGQIKSATDNNGEFDPTNPSMLRSALSDETQAVDSQATHSSVPAYSMAQLLEKDRDDPDFYEVATNTVLAEIRAFAASLDVVLEGAPWCPFGQVTGLEITDLFADRPGQGAGTQVMQRLVDLADQAGISVFIAPSSSRNRDFYGQFGFVSEKSMVSSAHMARHPTMSDEDMEEYGIPRVRAA